MCLPRPVIETHHRVFALLLENGGLIRYLQKDAKKGKLVFMVNGKDVELSREVQWKI